MAAVTTEDRDAFEAAIFKPPHLVRLIDLYGEFTDRLDKNDRSYFLVRAMDRFWETRDMIKVMNDIGRLWVMALDWTAALRPRWRVDISFAGRKIGEQWATPKQLRRRV